MYFRSDLCNSPRSDMITNIFEIFSIIELKCFIEFLCFDLTPEISFLLPNLLFTISFWFSDHNIISSILNILQYYIWQDLSILTEDLLNLRLVINQLYQFLQSGPHHLQLLPRLSPVLLTLSLKRQVESLQVVF